MINNGFTPSRTHGLKIFLRGILREIIRGLRQSVDASLQFLKIRNDEFVTKIGEHCFSVKIRSGCIVIIVVIIAGNHHQSSHSKYDGLPE